MIEQVEIPSTKAVGFKVSGKINDEDIKLVIDAINRKFQQEDKLAIYVELEDFQGISLKALIDDLKFGIPNMHRFNRKAVVSDKSWHETLMEISDKVMPGIDLKHFNKDEKEAALLWVIE